MTSRHPDALVFALCHEVGNLLTAMRLRADALQRDAGGTGPAAASLSNLAIRNGALLALIRPLLAGPTATRGLDPAAALERLGPDLEEASGGGARVEPAPGELPTLACDPEILHPLLLGAGLTAVDEKGTEGVVRVSARAAGDCVVFELAHAGAWQTSGGGARLSGVTLLRAVADEILGRLGGRATLEPKRLGFELPG